MDRKKYSAAIDLLGDKYGLPDFMYQDKVVSDLEKEQAREMIMGLKEKIKDISSSVKPGNNSILIPFKDALMGSLSREDF